MTTVVYPYHNNTNWDELRYSLRSLSQIKEESLQLCLVGEKPAWCKPDIFIETKNVGITKEAAIMNKLLLACQHKDVSNEFLMVNDDHYLLKTIFISEIAFWTDGSLEQKITEKGYGAYGAALKNTLFTLINLGLPTRHYDIHVPIKYQKDKFIDIMSFYDWAKKPTFVIKSLYCNTLMVEPTNMSDNVERGKGFNPNAMWLSTAHDIVLPTKKWIQNRFPTKSPWEI